MRKINDIVDLTENQMVPKEKVFRLIKTFDYPLKYPIYVEFYDREYFRSYFVGSNIDLKNPITGAKFKPRGLFQHKKKEHLIGLIFNDIWEKTLIHELVHAYQYEQMGKRLWRKLKKAYTDQYHLDPAEVQAEFYALKKIEEMREHE